MLPPDFLERFEFVLEKLSKKELKVSKTEINFNEARGNTFYYNKKYGTFYLSKEGLVIYYSVIYKGASIYFTDVFGLNRKEADLLAMKYFPEYRPCGISENSDFCEIYF